MLSVHNNKNIIIIKNSRFISLLYYVSDKEEINKYLSDAKIIYPDATHYCYAYILNGQEKAYDDGEPSGTAGAPILNVLKKNNLNCVLCIVIRYFGKIKLGAGGLVRAYSNSCSEVLKEHICELVEGYLVEVVFNYDSLKYVNSIIREDNILKKDFDNIISYTLKIDKYTYEVIKSMDYITIRSVKDTFL